MNAHVTLHPVTENDFQDWLPLWQGYLSFYQSELPDTTTHTTWQRFLDPLEPMFAVLARLDGKAVGLVHFIYHRSCWTTGDYCYLQDLFVEDTVRGHGVGRQLIEHVYARAGQDGCSRVHWLTHETNGQAMQLYDRIASRSGFVQYRQLLPLPAES